MTSSMNTVSNRRREHTIHTSSRQGHVGFVDVAPLTSQRSRSTSNGTSRSAGLSPNSSVIRRRRLISPLASRMGPLQPFTIRTNANTDNLMAHSHGNVMNAHNLSFNAARGMSADVPVRLRRIYRRRRAHSLGSFTNQINAAGNRGTDAILQRSNPNQYPPNYVNPSPRSNEDSNLGNTPPSSNERRHVMNARNRREENPDAEPEVSVAVPPSFEYTTPQAVSKQPDHTPQSEHPTSPEFVTPQFDQTPQTSVTENQRLIRNIRKRKRNRKNADSALLALLSGSEEKEHSDGDVITNRNTNKRRKMRELKESKST